MTGKRLGILVNLEETCMCFHANEVIKQLKVPQEILIEFLVWKTPFSLSFVIITVKNRPMQGEQNIIFGTNIFQFRFHVNS